MKLINIIPFIDSLQSTVYSLQSTVYSLQSTVYTLKNYYYIFLFSWREIILYMYANILFLILGEFYENNKL